MAWQVDTSLWVFMPNLEMLSQCLPKKELCYLQTSMLKKKGIMLLISC